MKLPVTGPRFVLLDGPGNWRLAGSGSAVMERESTLGLRPLPGTAEPLWPEEAPAELHTPAALAFDREGRLLVADAAAGVIHRVTFPKTSPAPGLGGPLTSAPADETPRPQLETLRAFGGEGRDKRNFRRPRGVAVLPAGEIAVADTGHTRVALFSPAPYALLELWEELPGPPWGVATGACGTFYFALTGAEPCVQHRCRDRLLQTYGRDGADELHLRRPTRLAVNICGVLAVVDRDPAPAAGKAGDTSRLAIFRPQTNFPPTGNEPVIFPILHPRAVAFDAAGTLFVGDAAGLIHRLEPDANAPSGFRHAGTGDTGLIREIVDLAWHAGHGLLAILRAEDGAQALFAIDPAGACERTGEVIAGPLDGLVRGRIWHRVQAAARLPSDESAGGSRAPGAELFSVAVQSFTTDEVIAAETIAGPWKPCFSSSADDPDGLVVSAAGRYLWLKITVRSDGRRSPALTSLRAHFPRASYLDHLPAVFQEDPSSRAFLERFLSLFQTGFDDFDRVIDNLWQRFDPGAVEEKDYPWLAAWLNLPFQPSWKLEKRRAKLQRTHRDYPNRGTIAGLTQSIEDYADVKGVQILEHFRLRHWARLATPPGDAPAAWPPVAAEATSDQGTPLFGREGFARMQLGDFSELGVARIASQPDAELEPFAAGAHRFTVFFPTDPRHVEETRERVREIVEAEKPAHTEAELRPVLPILRIGLQSCVGVNTLLGDYGPGLLGERGPLGETILGGTPEEQNLQALGTAAIPRVGLHTKLQ